MNNRTNHPVHHCLRKLRNLYRTFLKLVLIRKLRRDGNERLRFSKEPCQVIVSEGRRLKVNHSTCNTSEVGQKEKKETKEICVKIWIG